MCALTARGVAALDGFQHIAAVHLTRVRLRLDDHAPEAHAGGAVRLLEAEALRTVRCVAVREGNHLNTPDDPRLSTLTSQGT
jgi:hypothetical protein